MGLLLLFLLGALLISALCSILEASLLSTPLSYITMREEEGYKVATKFKEYKQDTNRPIAAILSLNTIANTIGAAGVGRQATLLFGSAWFGVVSAITTILILIFSEIIPKTIGAHYWRHLMGFTGKCISVLLSVRNLIQGKFPAASGFCRSDFIGHQINQLHAFVCSQKIFPFALGIPDFNDALYDCSTCGRRPDTRPLHLSDNLFIIRFFAGILHGGEKGSICMRKRRLCRVFFNGKRLNGSYIIRMKRRQGCFFILCIFFGFPCAWRIFKRWYIAPSVLRHNTSG